MDTNKIKNLIEEFMGKASFDFIELDVSFNEGSNQLWCRILSNNPQFLIGRFGETLSALSHIIRRIIIKEIILDNDQMINIIIDVNDYYKKKIENLKSLAHMMAERARFFKSNVEVKPMSSFDRRIIHEFISNDSDLETESTGEGRDRRVVIKYIQQ